jgi:hypothetical protein
VLSHCGALRPVRKRCREFKPVEPSGKSGDKLIDGGVGIR